MEPCMALILYMISIYNNDHINFSYYIKFFEFYLFQESELIQRLEMVACNGKCANIRSCEVALVSLCAYLDEIVGRSRTQENANLNEEIENKNSELLRLVEFASELQKICKVRIMFLIYLFVCFLFVSYNINPGC